MLTVCSFHTPPGASWKGGKTQSLLALANTIAERHSHTIVGMDANAPKTDHPDIGQNVWWWEEEPLMLGPRPLHLLKDALHTWLVAHPEEAEQIRRGRPQGPLAISFDRGRQSKLIPCRYDFVYHTPDFSVANIQYLYEAEVKAGSDHAAVVADLVLP